MQIQNLGNVGGVEICFRLNCRHLTVNHQMTDQPMQMNDCSSHLAAHPQTPTAPSDIRRPSSLSEILEKAAPAARTQCPTFPYSCRKGLFAASMRKGVRFLCGRLGCCFVQAGWVGGSPRLPFEAAHQFEPACLIVCHVTGIHDKEWNKVWKRKANSYQSALRFQILK